MRVGLYLFKTAIFSMLYLAFCYIGSWMQTPGLGSYVYMIWPPTGLALAVVMLGGFRYLPIILIGSLWWGHASAMPTLLALLMGINYMAVTALTTFLLRRLMKLDTRLETINDIGGFLIVGVALHSMIAAALNVQAFNIVDIFADWRFERFYWPLLLGDVMGVLVTTPFVFVWYARTKIIMSNKQVLEILLWLFALVFLGWVVFYNWAPTDTLRYPLELAMFPIMAWAAVRFGQRGATTGIVIVAIIALRELTWVLGTEERYISQSPSFLWMFVGIISTTSLFIAAVMTEQKRREEQSVTNEERIRAFVDAMPDIAFVIDREDQLVEVFVPQGDERYRQVRGEWSGQPLGAVFPPELAALFRATVATTLEENRTRNVEYAMTTGKQSRWYEGRVTPMLNEVGEADRVVWVAYEITQRKQAEALLQHRDALLESVTQAQMFFLATAEQRKAIEKAFSLLGERMEADAIFGIELQSDPGNAPSHFQWKRQASTTQADWAGWLRRSPAWRKRLEANEVVSLQRADLSAEEQRASGGMGAFLMVPVWVEQQLWGVMGAAVAADKHPWGEAERAALRLVSGSLGAFIVNRRAAEELLAARDSADKANRAKSEFLALISHEIRTPINAIIGFTDLLNQANKDPGNGDYISIIQRSSTSLLEMINTLLDFSRIESRGLELEVAPFDLEATTMEALELMLVRAREKGIELRFEEDTVEGPRTFHGDAMRVRQILLNLLNNAVKFTEKGSVVLKRQVAKQEDGRYRIHFSITDTGIGIPESKLGQLFEPFTQADSSTTRRYGGTGLGLTICKRLVEEMGGAITVQSREGEGSTFSFWLPLEEASADSMPVIAPVDDRLDHDFARQHPLRIALLEEDPANTRLDCELLSFLGYEPTVVATVEDALALLREEVKDVLLVDYHPPAGDGALLLEQIQSLGSDTNAVPKIIAMGAFPSATDAEKALAAGATLTLNKPLNTTKLKTLLRQIGGKG